MLENKRERWVWSLLIIASMVSAGGIQFLPIPVSVLRVILVWYLFVIPGMTFVKLLGLDGIAMQWTIAVALSISVNMLVSELVLYLDFYHPHTILGLVLLINLVGWVAFVRIQLFKTT